MQKWIINYSLSVDEEEKQFTAIVYANSGDGALGLIRNFVNDLARTYPDKDIWLKDYDSHRFENEEPKIKWNNCTPKTLGFEK